MQDSERLERIEKKLDEIKEFIIEARKIHSDHAKCITRLEHEIFGNGRTGLSTQVRAIIWMLSGVLGFFGVPGGQCNKRLVIMIGTITELTNAVVAELNAESWSQDVIVHKHYRPRYDSTTLSNIFLTVVPRSYTIDSSSRTHVGCSYVIDLAIQKKLSEESNEELDELISLVEEIANYFRDRRLAAMPNALCTKIENEPIYALEHLDEIRCFTSIITLTFLVLHDRV